MEPKQTKIFETNNLDFATFLLMEGERLLELRKDGPNVFMRFIDDLGKCRDLEQVYLRSDVKKFGELRKWLLKKVHEELNS